MPQTRIQLPRTLDDLPGYLRSHGYEVRTSWPRTLECRRDGGCVRLHLSRDRRTVRHVVSNRARKHASQLRPLLDLLAAAGATGGLVDVRATCAACGFALVVRSGICPECGETIRLAPIVRTPVVTPVHLILIGFGAMLAVLVCVHLGNRHPIVPALAFMLANMLGPIGLAGALLDVLMHRQRGPLNLVALVATGGGAAATASLWMLLVGR